MTRAQANRALMAVLVYGVRETRIPAIAGQRIMVPDAKVGNYLVETTKQCIMLFACLLCCSIVSTAIMRGRCLFENHINVWL